ncbi:MAG: sigma-70 family RNA polymerase sigma factor [Phycisphaerales bacterium]|nr:sigma-70 family RNA polymerase sigma factor [Phycisphaerales bacterium]
MQTSPDQPTPTKSFPDTQTLWISQRLTEGEAGRILVNGHVMTSYLRPLSVYCHAIGLATSLRCEPDELVHGFFASRLVDTSYLRSWIESGIRLRLWLRNGLNLYAHERYRGKSRERTESTAPPEAMSKTAEAEQLFERAWAISALDQAMSETKADLARRGRSSEWEIFWGHHIDGTPYATLAGRFQLTSAQAAQRAFSVAESLRGALAGILRKDGAIGSQLDAEVRAMMEALNGR